jgi:hypothetical protein
MITSFITVGASELSYSTTKCTAMKIYIECVGQQAVDELTEKISVSDG